MLLTVVVFVEEEDVSFLEVDGAVVLELAAASELAGGCAVWAVLLLAVVVLLAGL